jgi:hypothetical protein
MTIDRNSGRHESLARLSGRAYGIHLTGNLPQEFQAFLHSFTEPRADRDRDLRVSYRVLGELPKVDEIWVAEPRPPLSNNRLALFRQSGGFGLRVDCEGSGLFRFTPGRIEIEWLVQGAGAAHYFFAYALPLWLESRGMPVLHASAVSFGDRAVGLLGPSGVGKSTLCAGLVQAGCDFMADDGLVLREDGDGDWRCVHGPPFLRLWPSALEHRLGVAPEKLPRVYESLEKRLMRCAQETVSTVAVGLKLAAIYMLDRQAEERREVRISAFSARESVVRLIEHSLAAGPVAALGLSAQRLEQLSRVAEQTRVKRLDYPGGSDRWHRVREAILDDLAG